MFKEELSGIRQRIERTENKRLRELLEKVLTETREYGNVSTYTIMDIEQALEGDGERDV